MPTPCHAGTDAFLTRPGQQQGGAAAPGPRCTTSALLQLTVQRRDFKGKTFQVGPRIEAICAEGGCEGAWVPVCGSCFQLVGMEGELSPGNEHPSSQAQLCHELTKAGTALLP